MLSARLVAVWLVLLGAGLGGPGCHRPEPERDATARAGVLDLRGLSAAALYARRAPIRLTGEWQIYPGELRPFAAITTGAGAGADGKDAPPIYAHLGEKWERESWPDGRRMAGRYAATLRLKILLPAGAGAADAEPLALKVSPRARAVRVLVRDAKDLQLTSVLTTGVLGEAPEPIENSRRQLIGTLLPLTPRLGDSGPELELIVQVASTVWPRRSVPLILELGPESLIRRDYHATQQIQLVLVGVTLVIGLYHLALYAVRRSELAPLYFGLFCLVISLRQYSLPGYLEDRLVGLRIPRGVWDLTLRFELLALFSAVPLFCEYLHTLFPRSIPRRFPKALWIIGGTLAVVVLMVRSIPSATWTVYTFEVVTFLTALFVVARIVAFIRRGEGDQQAARFLALGTVLLSLAAANDVLHNIGVVRSVILEQYGMFAFIFCQAFVLAVQNARARQGAEKLAIELDRKNVALSRLDQMKDEFLANTSHELRTPLSGIIGLAEALLASQRLPPRAREQLKLIVASGRRLASLVNDILDFAKLRYDHLTLQRRRVDPRVVVDLVLALSRPLAAGKPLVLRNDLPDNTPDVLADENRLQQILTNLIGNAVKFTPEGTVAVSARVEGSFLAITVSDTGIGIDKADQARIFEAFSQADGSAAREAAGTGLGLTITRKLVELHGGTISVRSQPGVGSHFTFTLPQKGALTPETAANFEARPAARLPPLEAVESADAAELLEPEGPPPRTTSAPPPPPRGRERFRVLIVDDDPVNRAVLASQLTGAGYEVAEAGSGRAALDLLEHERCDAVVLDVMMPKMSGYEVLTELRKTHPASELPVLLLTAKNQEQDVAEGFRVGTNDYLTKPFSRTELLSRISTHITLAKTSIAYGRFVPHQFVQLLGKEHVVYVDIGDHVHLPQMTILFCDPKPPISVEKFG